jgi:hypothetical protein
VKSLTVADSWLSSSPRRNPVIDVDTRLQHDARELDVEVWVGGIKYMSAVESQGLVESADTLALMAKYCVISSKNVRQDWSEKGSWRMELSWRNLVGP